MKSRQPNPKHQEDALSPAKRRAFLAITLGFPILFLVLLEVGLRLIQYGPNLSLFREETILGKKVLMENDEVKARYFSRFAFNPTASPDYFLAAKPAGTFRIFCLGGSTTVGYPYWYNGSFSTFLRDRLKRIFPKRQFEVINVGMTATNSYTVLDMARDIVDHQPDLLIVYDGHNEFYGALGTASHESFANARWLTMTYLKLIHYRTFILLRDCYQWMAGKFRNAPSSLADGGTMMEKLARGQYITFRSAEYLQALDVFKANMNDLKQLCARHNIPLVLSSQASNLRGRAPFISDDPDRETSGQKASFDLLFSQAMGFWAKGSIDSALKRSQLAMDVDTLRADAHFLEARCLDSLGQKKAALEEYIKARDYDRLRFRMSTDFNNAVRNECDGQRVIFVDIERAFQEHSPDGIIGNEFILEHLHPNSRGYFLMGKEYVRAIRDNQFLASSNEWQRCDTISDEVLWNDRNLTELDEIIARRRTEILTSGWPFRPQVPTVSPVAMSDTLGHIAEMVTRAQWTWDKAHTQAAEYYLGRGEIENAEREYKTLTNMIPFEVTSYLKLARLYLDQKNYEATRIELLVSLEVKPTILAYRALADISMNRNQPKEAANFYEKTFSFEQTAAERVENGYLLALAFARANMLDRSADQLMRVLNIKPDYQPAVTLLAQIRTPPSHP